MPTPPVGGVAAGSPRQPGAGGLLRRLIRGRPADPAWVRPALLALLALTAVAYLWGLGDSGWANAFYSAAVEASTKSWRALFFGSFDAANFITVDKPPAALWVMDLSARLFGVNSWSILVPQAIEGVAAVAILYATVRRWFSPSSALLAGAALALTPVAALMFRFNNPDALLTLLLTASAYATVRALEQAETKWLVLAAALIGTGFITKMLAAFLVVPAIAVVYLLAAPAPLGRRLRQLLLSAGVLLVSSGWWVAVVQLTPTADRPYVGGSQDNSLLNLIFGYNGVGRLTGNEAGSVGASGPLGSRWGQTGWDRLFGSQMGGQISWLIPAAILLLIACIWWTRRAPRTDRTRTALLLWGGWFLVTGFVFSFAQGIIHPYYTVALAPAIAAIVAVGVDVLWQRRAQTLPRVTLSLAILATAAWSFVLLERTPTWLPELRGLVALLGIVAALMIALGTRMPPTVALAGVLLGLGIAFAGPAAYTFATVASSHSGAIPSAGPRASGGFGPFGGGGPPGGFGPGGNPGQRARGNPGFGRQGNVPGNFPGGANPSGGNPGFAAGRPFPGAQGAIFRQRGDLPSFGGGGGGGLLDISKPNAALVKLLNKDASHYTWVAATIGANSAAGYQLATDNPVMAIGGFNGTDPAPTLAEFERYVREGKVHYFIAGRGFGGGGLARGGGFTGGTDGNGFTGGNGGGNRAGNQSTASQISRWVQAHFQSTTVGGQTVYDLSAGATQSGSGGS